MLNQRLSAVQKVKTSFIEAEQRVDAAAIAAARSLADFLLARSEANLPIATGHLAAKKLQSAVAAAMTARSEFIEAHLELGGVPAEIGIAPRMWGPEDDCPDKKRYWSGEAGLQSVA